MCVSVSVVRRGEKVRGRVEWGCGDMGSREAEAGAP
jgi:hypothetical protein